MTKKPDLWMPLYISDYLRDTGHLTTEEHGAYLMLLLEGWTRGGRLPMEDERLALLSKSGSMERWRKLKPVIMEFFTKGDGFYYQKRQMAEVEKSRHIQHVRSEAGKHGGEQSATKRATKTQASLKQQSKQRGEQNPTPPQPQSQSQLQLQPQVQPPVAPLTPQATPDQAPATAPTGAVLDAPGQIESTNNNGRPMTEADVPLPPCWKMLCKNSGVPIGLVAHEIAEGRELAWVLAYLMATEGDVLKAKAKGKGQEIANPAGWFRAMIESGKSPPDRYLADAKRKLTEHGEKSIPADIKARLTEIAAAWTVAHKVRCPKCRCYYWTDETHVCPKPVGARASMDPSQETRA